MFTKMAHEAFMKLKQVRRRSWGGGYHIYIYIYIYRGHVRNHGKNMQTTIVYWSYTGLMENKIETTVALSHEI